MKLSEAQQTKQSQLKKNEVKARETTLINERDWKRKKEKVKKQKKKSKHFMRFIIKYKYIYSNSLTAGIVRWEEVFDDVIPWK